MRIFVVIAEFGGGYSGFAIEIADNYVRQFGVELGRVMWAIYWLMLIFRFEAEGKRKLKGNHSKWKEVDMEHIK